MRPWFFALLLLAGCWSSDLDAPTEGGGAPAPPTSTPAPTAQATMNEVFNSVVVLLPLSFDAEGWFDSANSDSIVAELGSLSRSVKMLEGHAADRDVGFGWLAASLGDDVALAERAYLRGARSQARHYLQRAIDNCVACHTRLPGDAGGEFGMRLFSALDANPLSPVELASLLQATRQYEAAMANYEEWLATPASRSEHVVRLSALEDYLSLCVRVASTPERARPLLEGLLAQDDLPRFLAKDVAAWLKDLTVGPPPGDAVPVARSLIESASTQRDFPAGRADLIRFLRAASLLDQATQTLTGAPLAEAYYLLGVAETNLSRSSRLGNAEVFLEAAIREAPRSAFAADSLDRLEWLLALEYSGSGGAQLPPELEERLTGLRRLVRGQ